MNRDVGSIEVAAGVNRRLMWVRKNFLLRTTATAEARAQCPTPKTAPAAFCRWLLDLLFFAKHTHCLSLSNWFKLNSGCKHFLIWLNAMVHRFYPGADFFRPFFTMQIISGGLAFFLLCADIQISDCSGSSATVRRSLRADADYPLHHFPCNMAYPVQYITSHCISFLPTPHDNALLYITIQQSTHYITCLAPLLVFNPGDHWCPL